MSLIFQLNSCDHYVVSTRTWLLLSFKLTWHVRFNLGLLLSAGMSQKRSADLIRCNCKEKEREREKERQSTLSGIDYSLREICKLSWSLCPCLAQLFAPPFQRLLQSRSRSIFSHNPFSFPFSRTLTLSYKLERLSRDLRLEKIRDLTLSCGRRGRGDRGEGTWDYTDSRQRGRPF